MDTVQRAARRRRVRELHRRLPPAARHECGPVLERFEDGARSAPVTLDQLEAVTLATPDATGAADSAAALEKRLPPVAADAVVGRMDRALRVIALDPRIRAFLIEHDPKALEQVEEALTFGRQS